MGQEVALLVSKWGTDPWYAWRLHAEGFAAVDLQSAPAEGCSSDAVKRHGGATPAETESGEGRQADPEARTAAHPPLMADQVAELPW